MDTISDRPILYSFRRCPYAMRARMALLSSGTICTHREILLCDKPEAMLEASPKGTVPVLILPDGKVVEESLDVAFYALEGSDPQNWLEPWQHDKVGANALIAWNDGDFKHHLDRYKYATRYDDIDPTEHRREGMKFIHALEERLTGQDWLTGGRFTFLDAAIAPFVRQFRIADRNWFDDNAPEQVRDWLARFVDRDDFTIVMKKYAVWSAGNPEVTFPAS